MAEKFTLSAVIKVLDQATNPIRKIGRSFGMLSKDLEKTQKKLLDVGNAMQNVGKNMSAKITAPIAGLSIMAVKSAADIETLTISFESLTGSTEIAKKTVEDLVKFTAQTPFQLDGVGKAAKQLLAAEVPTSDLIDKLKYLGDISAGANIPLTDMAAIFGKAKAKGKAMTEELLQLSDRGIPIIGVLAKQLDVSKDKVFEMASKSKISFEVLEKALQSMTQGTGIFANQTLKQSKSITGVFSTMRDNINLALASLGDFLVEQTNLKEVMNDVIVTIQKAVEQFKNFTKANPELARMLLIVTGIVAALGPLLWVVGSVAKQMSFAVKGIMAFIKFGGGMLKMIGFITKAIMVLSSALIKVAMFMLANPILLAITAIAVAAFLIIKYWEPIKEFFSKLWGDIVDIAVIVGKKLSDIFVQPFIDLWDMAGGVFDKIKQGIKDLAGFLPDWAQEKLGLRATVETDEFSPGKMKQSIDQKSETDVTIRVESDQGTTATIDKVKTKGTNKPTIETNTFMGPLAFGM